jgi:hypothetical protein
MLRGGWKEKTASDLTPSTVETKGTEMRSSISVDLAPNQE